ncbi:MAG: hypothetical protein QOH93_2823 [Chloroflexia bacterium]|jgi:hypothetical protein|nr:hypothetical protein [Chloroflexia bacterium]
MGGTDYNYGTRSQPLLLRIWEEEGADGKKELCGKVQQVVGGRARSFRGLPDLLETLVSLTSPSTDGNTTTE